MARTLKECPACGTMLLMKSNQKFCRGACRQKALKLRAAAAAAAGAASATAAAQVAAEAASAAVAAATARAQAAEARLQQARSMEESPPKRRSKRSTVRFLSETEATLYNELYHEHHLALYHPPDDNEKPHPGIHRNRPPSASEDAKMYYSDMIADCKATGRDPDGRARQHFQLNKEGINVDDDDDDPCGFDEFGEQYDEYGGPGHYDSDMYNSDDSWPRS